MGSPGTCIPPLQTPEERGQQQRGEMGVAPCPSWEPWKGQDGSPVQKPSHTLLHVHISIRIFTNRCLLAGPVKSYSCPLSLFVCILALSGILREFLSPSGTPPPHPHPSTEGQVTGKAGSSHGPVAERSSGSTKGAVAIPDDRVLATSGLGRQAGSRVSSLGKPSASADNSPDAGNVCAWRGAGSVGATARESATHTWECIPAPTMEAPQARRGALQQCICRTPGAFFFSWEFRSCKTLD